MKNAAAKQMLLLLLLGLLFLSGCGVKGPVRLPTASEKAEQAANK